MYSTFPVYRISRLNSNRIFSNLDTNKKTFDTLLNLQSCLPIVASLTALSNAKQVQIRVQTERSSMVIQLTYILFNFGWFKMFSIECSKLLSIDMISENAGFC
jgi:hypothetical protein